MSIYRGPGGSGDAVADSSSEALLVQQLAIEAQADADAAAASATNASDSASDAATSATNAANSATSASNSASSAATSATNAANSAASIVGDVAAAEAAQLAASNSATAAATSETNAASSASSASTSASTATTQATNASNSATAAATSATNASNSASAAATSATNAGASATSAAGSASAASTSASNASTSATNAASSATSAAGSATTATTQAGIATTQASNAATSAADALSSRDAAAAYSVSASNSASTALSAANSAAASYDAFDDRYLGSKSSDPTLDNDGNALLDGALYFDTTNNVMKVYDLGTTTWLRTTPTSSDQTAINTVNSNATNINTVAGISGNVTTVATNNTNVTAVATNIASVNTNATNIANINQNAANIVAIQNASANATAAASSATAAAGSATSASASAAAASAVVLGNEPVRHSVRPSLLLDFANTKQLDPRITFSRPTTATFYDGKTVAKAEENLLNPSADFSNNFAVTRASVTINVTAAPDGTTTADQFIEDTTATNTHRLFFSGSIPVIIGLPYTASIFAKKNTRDQLFIRRVGGSGFDADGCLFDLTAGTVSNIGTGATGSIVSVGNGWYRCIVVSVNAVAQTNQLNMAMAVAGNLNYTGDGTSGIYVWGAQLEQRSSVTAYTPTTTAPITNYIPALQTAAAGVARFEHNPITGESLGLEIEEQRTNLLLRSEELDNASWIKTRSSALSNTIVAPDGTLTGEKVIEDTTASNSHAISRGVGSAARNVVYAFSVYAKAAERTQLRLRLNAYSGDTVTANFNLTLGTVISSSNTGTGAGATGTIVSVGNGWYRCTLVGTPSTTVANGLDSDIFMLDATGNGVYTGDGYSGIYIWGAQLEAGSFPTSYIPTVASQVTRSADLASMTGTNFSSWYRADEGTLYTEAKALAAVVNQTFVTIDDGSTNNAIYLVTSPSNSGFDRFQVNVAGVAQVALGTSGFVATDSNKLSCAYKVNDFSRAYNGGAALTDTSGTVPVVTTLRLGSRTSSDFLNGTIKKLAYYPKRLTNAELQGLTTV